MKATKASPTTRLPAAARAACIIVLALPSGAVGQELGAEPAAASIRAVPAAPSDPTVPELAPLLGGDASRMAAVVERFDEDRSALYRRHGVPWSADRRDRLRRFFEGWRERLRALDYDALDVESRIDWVLLDSELRYRLHELDRERLLFDERAGLLRRPRPCFSGPLVVGSGLLARSRAGEANSEEPTPTASPVQSRSCPLCAQRCSSF